MNILYLDAFAGISGDMTVGGLLALGLPLAHLQETLAQLPLRGYHVSATPRHVNGIGAIKFDVHVDHAAADHHHTHRAFTDIRAMIETSALPVRVKDSAIAIFTKLAEAEGRVHGMPAEQVTFHEVGAVDSIIDIVGTAIGMAYFSIDRVYVSALPLGSGIVHSQHGPLPVPPPATVELLGGFTTRLGDGEGELVTPTGAAIVATMATPESVPDLRIQRVGYGAGQRVLHDRPNLLRLVLAQAAQTAGQDELMVIETNIDDLNPELYEHVMERLFAAGARDVYLTPVHMKKNRPGTLLSVLCAEAERQPLANIVLSETSAIGLRYYPVRRLVLERKIITVATPYGDVRVKIALDPSGNHNVAPEYEDCRRIAAERSVPLKLVYQAAIAAAAQALGLNRK
jgi:pyridinium-3,5-bisthiocarboxylic acid mononucleotide nickel chelatase